MKQFLFYLKRKYLITSILQFTNTSCHKKWDSTMHLSNRKLKLPGNLVKQIALARCPR